MEIKNFLLVGAGGAAGSMLRYAVSILIGTKSFPLATLTVNIAGSFIIGILLSLSIKSNVSDYTWKFLGIGICGGFTTFSTFSLEGFHFLQQQRYFIFLLYIVVSIISGVTATFTGYFLAK